MKNKKLSESELSDLLDSIEDTSKIQMDIAIFGCGGGIWSPDGSFEYKTPEELDEIYQNSRNHE